jgi:hypothetical protein
MAKRIVWSSCITRFFYMGDIMVVSDYLPIYFRTVKENSPVRSGYYILPLILISMVFAVGVSSAGKKKFAHPPPSLSVRVMANIPISFKTWISPSLDDGQWSRNGNWGWTLHQAEAFDSNRHVDWLPACVGLWKWTWNYHCQFSLLPN